MPAAKVKHNYPVWEISGLAENLRHKTDIHKLSENLALRAVDEVKAESSAVRRAKGLERVRAPV
jgi:hypothetical protein